MEPKVLLAPAYILELTPYRNTSLILQVFAEDYGRLTLVAKGARRSQSKWHVLQLFQPLLLSWVGRSEMKTLTDAETAGVGAWLQGKKLYSGLYLNELLLKLLKPWDAYPELYGFYQQALMELVNDQVSKSRLELCLRRFEMHLLEELGYGLSVGLGLSVGEASTTEGHVTADQYYGFDEQQGLVCLHDRQEPYSGAVISGAALQALLRQDLSANGLRQELKLWMRYVIRILLGGNALNVRKVMS